LAKSVLMTARRNISPMGRKRETFCQCLNIMIFQGNLCIQERCCEGL
jgi:hypothetical protein